LNLLPSFPSLETLRLSCNGLGRIPGPLPAPKLKELDLSSNKITSLRELGSLASLPALVNLSLRDNPIKTLETDTAFPATTFLDLKSTLPTNLSSLDPIPTTFPSLTRLLTANTPLTTIPSAKLLTIARLPTLTELNWAPITAAERQNAELYYLSTIVKELTAATNTREEKQILSEHPRWDSLCKIHGVPDLPKKPSIAEDEATAGTLAARVTKFTFYMTVADLKTAHKRVPLCNSSAQADDLSYPTADKNSNLIEKSKLIPRTVDVYRLKGIVGRLFSIQPMSCKLIWETGEWDPVGGREEDEGWSVSEDDESERGEERGATMQAPRGRDRSRWERREMELVDGTREVGFWVEGKTARVRVEPRYSY